MLIRRKPGFRRKINPPSDNRRLGEQQMMEKENEAENAPSGTAAYEQGQTISQMLDEIESKLGRFGRGSGRKPALEILYRMDGVLARIKNANASGNNISAEQRQFEFLAATIQNAADLFLREISIPVYVNERDARRPSPDHTWWFVDRDVADRRRSGIRKSVYILIAAAAVIGLLVFAYQTFLAPDPATRARLDLQYQAEKQLADGDLQGALASIKSALDYAPDDPELLLYQGGIEYKLGDKGQSQQTFNHAQQIIGNQEQFLTSRAAFWMQSGEYELAKSDANQALVLNPDSAVATYYMGKANEFLGNRQDALAAYNRASQLAEEQGQVELMASIRINIGMLMQSMNVEMPTQPGEATSTP